MTDVKINVVSDSSAARQDIQRLANSVDRVANAANNASKASSKMGSNNVAAVQAINAPIKEAAAGISGLTKLAIGFAGAIALGTSVNGFYKISDSLTQVKNKLKLVTDSNDELIYTQRRVLDLSQKTNSSLEETASLYYNISKATKSSGLSQARMLALVETIQKSVAVSGSSATSAQGAVLQLNQALANGVLRGDELNSVMEGMPRLAEAIAKGMGIPFGELRTQAEAGLITTSVMLKAIEGQGSVIGAEFAKTSRTAAEGLRNLSGALKIAVGEIDGMGRFSSRFSTNMSGLATSILEHAPRMKTHLYLITTSITDFITELRSFSSIALTARKVISTLSFSGIFTVYEGYSNVKAALDVVTQLLQKVGLVKKEESYLDKISNRLIEKLVPADFKDYFSNVDTSKPRELYDILKDLGNLFLSIGYTVVGLTSKLSTVVPNILLPVQDVVSEIKRSYDYFTTIAVAGFTQQSHRMRRGIEAALDFSNLKIFTDTTIERATSRLFRSDSIVELTSNFRDLGAALSSTRGGNINILETDAVNALDFMAENVKSVLMYFNLIDNRLLFINNIRFDRAIDAFKIFGNTIKQVYQDNFAYPVAKIVAHVTVIAGAIYDAITDAIIDKLTTSRAEAIGQAIAESLGGGFKAAVGMLKKLFNIDSGVLENALSFNIKPNKMVAALKTVFVFITTVLQTIIKDIVGTLPIAMTDMVDKIIDQSARLMDTAGKNIRKFTTYVAELFFEVYDKVVGHSYWPDLINGVIEDSKRLQNTAATYVAKFTGFVIDKFKTMRDVVVGALEGTRLGNVLLEFNYKSIGDKLYLTVASAITGALLFAFGGLTGKLLALSSLGDVLEKYLIFPVINGLDQAVGVYLPQEIARALGTGIGFFIKTALQSAWQYLEVLLRSVPTFINAILDQFGVIGSAIKLLAGFVTFGQTGLLYTMLFGYLGYKGITGNLGDVFKSIKSIGSYGASIIKGAFIPTSPLVGVGTSAFAKARAAKKSKGKGKEKDDDFYSTKLFGASANPSLLLAGIAAVSAGVLDSVSAFESIATGVPLLLWAILGQDGGGRMLAQIKAKLFSLVGTAYSFLKGMAANTAIGGAVAQMFGGPSSAYLDAGKKIASGVYGPVKTAFSLLIDGSKNMLINMSRNREAFAKGHMSMTELFFGKPSQTTFIDLNKGFGVFVKSSIEGVAKIREAWVGLKSASGSVGAVSSTGGIKAIADWANSAKDAAKTAFTPFMAAMAQFSPMVVGSFKQAFELIKSGLTTFAVTMAAGVAKVAGDFGFLGQLLTGNKGKAALLGLIAAVMLFFVGSASAASVATARISSEVSTFTLLLNTAAAAIVAIVAAIVAIPLAILIVGTYTAGWTVALLRAKTTLFAITGAIGAIGRALWYVGGLFAGLWTATTMAATTMAPILAGGIWKAMAVVASRVWYLLSKLVATFQIAWAIIGGFTGAVVYLGSVIVTMLAGLVSFLLTPIGMILALAATIGSGILYTMLFGKGRTFFEKLEYVKDQVLSLFGGASANDPRENRLQALASDTTANGKRYEFSDKLSMLDYSSMKDSEFDDLLKLTERVGTLLKSHESTLKDGVALTEQEADNVDTAYNRWNDLWGRANKVSGGVDKMMSDVIDTVNMSTLSWNQKVYNFFNYTGERIQQIIDRFVNKSPRYEQTGEPLKFNTGIGTTVTGAVWRLIFSYTADLNREATKAMGEFVDGMGVTLANSFRKLMSPLNALIAVFEGPLFTAISKLGDKAMAYWDRASGSGEAGKRQDLSDRFASQRFALKRTEAFRSAEENLQLEKQGIAFKNATLAFYAKKKKLSLTGTDMELEALQKDMDAKRKIFEHSLPEKIAKGEHFRDISGYKEVVDHFIKAMTAATGDKMEAKDMVFELDVRTRAYNISKEIAKEIEVINNAKADYISVPAKFRRDSLVASLKELLTDAKAAGSFESLLELRMKISGVDLSKDAMLDFSLNNEVAFKEWERLSDKLRGQKQAIKDIPAEASSDFRNSVIRDARDTEAALKNILPKASDFARLNAAYSSAGGSNLSHENFKLLGNNAKRLMENMEGANEALAKWDANPPQNLSLEQALAITNSIVLAVKLAKKEIDALGIAVPERVAAAFSGSGATVPKYNMLSNKQQDGLLSKTNRIETLRETIAKPETSREDRRLAEREIAKLEKTASPLFETPSDSIFERFSKLAQESGISITIEQWIQLADTGRDRIKKLMIDSAANLKKMADAGGLFPKDIKLFRTLTDAATRAKEEVAETLAGIPVAAMERINATIDGTGITAPEFFKMNSADQDALLFIQSSLERIKRQKEAIKLTGLTDSKSVAALRKLNDEEVKDTKEKGDAAFNGLPLSQKAVKSAELLGIKFEDKDLIKLMLPDLERLVLLRNSLRVSEDTFEFSSKSPADWVTAVTERLRITTEANKIGKSEIQQKLELLGISGVETDNILGDIKLRGQLLSLMEKMNEASAEYKALKSRKADGLASQEELDRFKVLSKLWGGVNELSTLAADTKPILNLKDLAEELKLDLVDLINMPSIALINLKDNREDLNRLYNQLYKLGMGEVDAAREISDKIQKRLKYEQEITQQISDRKQLTDDFKSTFSDGLSKLFRGEGSGIRLAIADKIGGFFTKQLSDTLFSGLSANLSKLMTPKGGLGGSLSAMFDSNGAMGGVGDMFRKGGMLEDVGSFMSGIFGAPDTKFDGSADHPFWVRIFGLKDLGELGINTDLISKDGSIAGDIESTMNTTFKSIETGMDGVWKNFSKILSGLLGGITGRGFDWTGVIIKGIGMAIGGMGGGAADLSTSDIGIGGAGAGGWAGAGGSYTTPEFYIPPEFDTGGVVSGAFGSPQLVLAHAGETILPTHKKSASSFGNSTVVNLTITGDISRQTKSQIFEMLPQIAAGVNSHNREAGVRV